MTDRSRVAVTGATGRLGRALMRALDDAWLDPIGWPRPAYDLDDPDSAQRMLAGPLPRVVIHAAAWTDVDGCSRHPGTALRRNAEAARELAAATSARGIRMVLISTNEVFDGDRSDGLGYAESDPPRPINTYGESKLRAEELARQEFLARDCGGNLSVVRTAWLFGPPGNDFPTKILAAADRLAPGESLKVVADEIGSPSYTTDVARAIVRLIADDAYGATYHLVNEGAASRLEVARLVLARCRGGRDAVPIGRADFERPSTPPAWGVLRNVRAAALGVTLRSWPDALEDYLAPLCAD